MIWGREDSYFNVIVDLNNSKNHVIFTRSYDEFENEKCFEMCPHCGEDVMLDRIKKVRQTCPSCNDKFGWTYDEQYKEYNQEIADKINANM